MALINCPDCNTEVSDKAIQCPKCAYPISTLFSHNFTTQEISNPQNITVNVQQPNVSHLVLLSARKSEGLAFLLIFLFGPFGLLYANPKNASAIIGLTIMAVVVCAIIITNNEFGYSIVGLISLVSWVVSIVLGMQGITEYNNSLLQTDDDRAINSKQTLDQIDKLRLFIKEEKYLPFYAPSKRPEILQVLNSICDTKKNTALLLEGYSTRYNLNLLEDLKSLSTSYENIEEYLENFIEYGFVDNQFPKL